MLPIRQELWTGVSILFSTKVYIDLDPINSSGSLLNHTLEIALLMTFYLNAS